MLNPKKVIDFIQHLRFQNHKVRIYLYTALYHRAIRQIIPLVDGIHYSVHEPCNFQDVFDFNAFQADIAVYGKKEQSFRLFIEAETHHSFSIIPNLWKRVEIKQFLKDCPLIDGEQLFIWKE